MEWRSEQWAQKTIATLYSVPWARLSIMETWTTETPQPDLA